MNLATVTLAIGAGMLATVNPCGFAMLPGLVSFYLSSDSVGYRERPTSIRLRDGIAFGITVTAGFLAVFAALGLVVSFAAAGVSTYLPWGTVVMGVVLAVLGLWLFAGRHIFVRVPIIRGEFYVKTRRAMLLYGMAYAIASLGCTLPIFLVVVGASLVAGPGRFILFIAYGFGLGIVLTSVAVATVLFQGAISRYLRRIVPYVQQIGALLLIVAGTYMVVTEYPVLAH
ncbi:MAG: cytochrome c biogenesis CcdA family protein [Chloroflexota bacterium]